MSNSANSTAAAASNEAAVKTFPVRFAPARKGVQSEHFIDGNRAFPHKDGTQPKPWETYMCSTAFTVPGKKVTILHVHEKVVKSGNSGKTEKSGDRRHLFTADTAMARARTIIEMQPTKSVSMSNLADAFLQRMLASDATAKSLRDQMVETLATIADLEGKIKAPRDRIMAEPAQCRELGEQVFRARHERSRLKMEQSDLNGERLQELGERSKRFKAGGSTDKTLEAEIEALKAKFAERQEPLSAAIKANRELLDGNGDWDSKGLEWELLWAVGGLAHLDEAVAARDEFMKAVADVFSLHSQMQKGKEKLAVLVNAYEHRLQMARTGAAR